MRTNKSDRKARKSVKLSQDSVAFLEGIRRQQRSTSISAVLEEVLQTVRREHNRKELEKAVSNYSSSLSSVEATEQTEWGEFAEQQFPRDEGEGLIECAE
jgi:hypothetical protein